MGIVLRHIGSAFEQSEDQDFTALEGVRDIYVSTDSGRPIAYVLSGPNPGGWLSAWDVSADVPLVGQIALTGAGSGGVTPELAPLAASDGEQLMVSGLGAANVIGALAGVDRIRGVTASVSQLEALTANSRQIVAGISGGGVALFDLTAKALDQIGTKVFPADMAPTGLAVSGNLVVVGGVGETVLTVFRAESGGGLTALDRIVAAENPGIAGLVQVETAKVGSTTYVIATGAQSNSLSVFRLGSDGSLTVTDHLNDTVLTRFASARVLEVVPAGDHALVIVGGDDRGLSVLRLLPDGTLLQEGLVEDTLDTALTGLTAISAYRTDAGQVGVAALSASEQGLSLYQLAGTVDRRTIWASGGSATNTGGAAVVMGSSGNDRLRAGAAGDILRDGRGADTLIGGAGADVFTLVTDGSPDRIEGFDPDQDMLDLSGWAFYRGLSQLQITATDTGALITFALIDGTETLTIQSANGRKIPYSKLITTIMEGPTRTLLAWVDPIVEDAAKYQPTSGNDSITGTDWNDLFDPTDGNDWIDGAGGNDSVLGGAGRDTLIGGDGLDTLRGGNDTDELRGMSGNDLLAGDAGNDLLIGWSGADRLLGGDGDDTLIGGSGNDLADGGAGDDVIKTGSGNDTLLGRTGNDVLVGGGGNDVVKGDSGNDVIKGNGGADTLSGGAGADRMLGGGKNDVLLGQGGNDSLYGNGGADRIKGNGGADLLNGGGGGDYLSGGGKADRLLGASGNDTLIGGGGNDRLEGGSGNDKLTGSAGNDTLIAGSGNDVLTGGGGRDVFVFSGGRDRITDFDPARDRLLLDRDIKADVGGRDLDDISWKPADDGYLFKMGDAGTLTVLGRFDPEDLLDDLGWF
ncbi:calcium-binding protein [Donghicola mangrovi]|uniref:Calcium-binding protein n=1 Tax=Donghicola mangrovi TaxID=2729614 RepID=A0A850QHA5_9RHOB|nr:calcium-binding protein [Donghicola mangrovi]NVO25201.1 calcium-binding protein [Donghicola mangrovi]